MGYITNITSRQNQLILKYSKLKSKKVRDDLGLFFFEGEKLFKEAISNNASIEAVFIKESYLNSKLFDNCSFPLYSVSDSVYEKLTNENSPEGIFTICKVKKNKERKDGIILILDTLQDPGNVGTIIRSADSFLCKKIICSLGCADIYSDKAIRASMGAIFRMCIETDCDIVKEIEKLKNSGYTVYSSLLDRNSEKLGNIDSFNNCAFVIGNEGKGISDDVKNVCSKSVYIPMGEDTSESLNASVAASIILYKASEKELLN